MPNEMVTFNRDCKVSIIPSGDTMILATGTQVWITQALGGSYTVMTGTGHLVRIDNRDADAIGKEITAAPAAPRQKPKARSKRWYGRS